MTDATTMGGSGDEQVLELPEAQRQLSFEAPLAGGSS